MSRYLRPTLPTVCLQASVTLCAVARFTYFHLHKVPGGLPSYILRTGSGRTDGRDVEGVIRRVPLIVVFGVGTQRTRRPVMTRRGWRGVISFSFAVRVGQGRVTLPCKSLWGVRAPNSEYTRFPLVGKALPSVLDLAFANPPLLPLVNSREASLPSTGSDHIPITITLTTRSLNQKPPRPRWADMDWETLDPIIKGFKVPAAPSCPTPPKLDEGMSESLNRLIALLKDHRPVSRPSHHSKPWWTYHLTVRRTDSP